jgi:outer membrane lipoprotein-sorting protein
VTVATNDFALQATELWFADGSRMRNDFTNAVMNPPLEGTLFAPPIPPDYKVTEPGAQ